MTLQEAINNQTDEWLYIGSLCSFVWIGRREQAIEAMPGVSEKYKVLLQRNIKNAERRLDFNTRSLDGVINLKESLVQIIHNDEDVELDEFKNEVKQAFEYVKSIKSNDLFFIKKKFASIIDYKCRKFEKSKNKMIIYNSASELNDAIEKIIPELNELSRKYKQEVYRLNIYLSNLYEQKANWKPMLERNVEEIYKRKDVEPLGTIIVIDGKEEGAYWFYSETPKGREEERKKKNGRCQMDQNHH